MPSLSVAVAAGSDTFDYSCTTATRVRILAVDMAERYRVTPADVMLSVAGRGLLPPDLRLCVLQPKDVVQCRLRRPRPRTQAPDDMSDHALSLHAPSATARIPVRCPDALSPVTSPLDGTLSPARQPGLSPRSFALDPGAGSSFRAGSQHTQVHPGATRLVGGPATTTQPSASTGRWVAARQERSAARQQPPRDTSRGEALARASSMSATMSATSSHLASPRPQVLLPAALSPSRSRPGTGVISQAPLERSPFAPSPVRGPGLGLQGGLSAARSPQRQLEASPFLSDGAPSFLELTGLSRAERVERTPGPAAPRLALRVVVEDPDDEWTVEVGADDAVGSLRGLCPVPAGHVARYLDRRILRESSSFQALRIPTESTVSFVPRKDEFRSPMANHLRRPSVMAAPFVEPTPVVRHAPRRRSVALPFVEGQLVVFFEDPADPGFFHEITVSSERLASTLLLFADGGGPERYQLLCDGHPVDEDATFAAACDGSNGATFTCLEKH